MPTLLQKIVEFDYSKIINKFKSLGIDMNPYVIQNMVFKLGIPINKEQLLQKIEPYDSLGLIQLLETIYFSLYPKSKEF